MSSEFAEFKLKDFRKKTQIHFPLLMANAHPTTPEGQRAGSHPLKAKVHLKGSVLSIERNGKNLCRAGPRNHMVLPIAYVRGGNRYVPVRNCRHSVSRNDVGKFADEPLFHVLKLFGRGNFYVRELNHLCGQNLVQAEGNYASLIAGDRHKPRNFPGVLGNGIEQVRLPVLRADIEHCNKCFLTCTEERIKKRCFHDIYYMPSFNLMQI